jgi:hypothetical protein
VGAADFSFADLHLANLHDLKDAGTSWSGAGLASAVRTDLDRLEAEAWLPPERPRT